MKTKIKYSTWVLWVFVSLCSCASAFQVRDASDANQLKMIFPTLFTDYKNQGEVFDFVIKQAFKGHFALNLEDDMKALVKKSLESYRDDDAPAFVDVYFSDFASGSDGLQRLFKEALLSEDVGTLYVLFAAGVHHNEHIKFIHKSLLYWAAQFNKISAAKLLIAAKLDFHQRTPDGKKFSQCALEYGHDELAELLFVAEASLGWRDWVLNSLRDWNLLI